jgi:hypothetical protein
VRGAASGPVDRASRARSVRRLADNQKVTPRYPASSNHPPNGAPPTITPGQTPTHAAKPRLTAGFGRYDCGHSTPPEAATPTTHEPPHHRSPAVLTATRPDRPAHPAKRERRRRRDDPEQRARHLERRRSPFSLSRGDVLPLRCAHPSAEPTWCLKRPEMPHPWSVPRPSAFVPRDARYLSTGAGSAAPPSRVACTAYPSARHSTTRSVVHPRKGARRPWGPTAACASPAPARMTTRRGLGGYTRSSHISTHHARHSPTRIGGSRPPARSRSTGRAPPNPRGLDGSPISRAHVTHRPDPCRRRGPRRQQPARPARLSPPTMGTGTSVRPRHNRPSPSATCPRHAYRSARHASRPVTWSARLRDAGTQRCRGGEPRQATSARSARHIRSPGVRPALRKAGTELTDR